MKEQILNLGKDSLIYGVGSVITRFIGLFTLPLFTAYLTPAEYGVLAMLALLTMVAQPLFSLGLGAAMGPCYFEKDDIQNKSTVVWTTFLIHTLSSALLIVIGWAYPTIITKLVRLSAEHNLLIGLSLTGCAFTIMATAITLKVQFEKQAKLYVVVTLITTFSAVLLSIITVVIFGWGVKGMVIGQLSGNAITLFALLVIAFRNTRLKVSGAIARVLVRNGFPLIPSFAFIFIIMHGNKYLLEWELGLDAVGVYSIGFNLGMTLSIVTGGIATAWFPFFLRYIERQLESSEIFSRIFTYYVFGVGLLTLFYFIFAKSLVTLLTQDSYYGAYSVIGFVALANFSQTLFGFFLPGLYFNKEIKYVSIIQGVTAVLSLPLNYCLIINLGVLGAAIALAVSNALMVAVLYCWNTINRSRYPCINYEWARVFRFFAMAVVICIANELISTNEIYLEVLKSVLMATLAVLAVYALLNCREKVFFDESLKIFWRK